jgi:hypothetical protein
VDSELLSPIAGAEELAQVLGTHLPDLQVLGIRVLVIVCGLPSAMEKVVEYIDNL